VKRLGTAGKTVGTVVVVKCVENLDCRVLISGLEGGSGEPEDEPCIRRPCCCSGWASCVIIVSWVRSWGVGGPERAGELYIIVCWGIGTKLNRKGRKVQASRRTPARKGMSRSLMLVVQKIERMIRRRVNRGMGVVIIVVAGMGEDARCSWRNSWSCKVEVKWSSSLCYTKVRVLGRDII